MVRTSPVDERIHQIPESLLGPDFLLNGTEGHLRVGDTAWRSDDRHDEDLGWVKVAIYLDPLTKDDGCLRVIPGTHKWHEPDLLSLLRHVDEDPGLRPFGISSDEIPSMALETEPGDVLVFAERIIHGAFGGGVGRHQICASFVANPKTDRHMAQIKSSYNAST